MWPNHKLGCKNSASISPPFDVPTHVREAFVQSFPDAASLGFFQYACTLSDRALVALWLWFRSKARYAIVVLNAADRDAAEVTRLRSGDFGRLSNWLFVYNAENRDCALMRTFGERYFALAKLVQESDSAMTVPLPWGPPQ